MGLTVFTVQLPSFIVTSIISRFGHSIKWFLLLCGKEKWICKYQSARRHYQRLITSVSQSRHRHNARISHLLLSNQTRRKERIQQPRICTFYSREIFNFEIRFRSHQMKYYKLQLYNDFYFFITFRNRFGASRYSETISLLHKIRFPSDMSIKILNGIDTISSRWLKRMTSLFSSYPKSTKFTTIPSFWCIGEIYCPFPLYWKGGSHESQKAQNQSGGGKFFQSSNSRHIHIKTKTTLSLGESSSHNLLAMRNNNLETSSTKLRE